MSRTSLPYVEEKQKQFLQNGKLYNYFCTKIWLPSGKQKRFDLRATTKKQAQRLALEKKIEVSDKKYFDENAALFHNKIPMETALKQLATLVIQEKPVSTSDKKEKKPLGESTIKKNLLPMLSTVGKHYLVKNYKYLHQINEPNFWEKLIAWIRQYHIDTSKYYEPLPRTDAIDKLMAEFPNRFEYSKNRKSLVYIGIMKKQDKAKYMNFNLSKDEQQVIESLYNQSQSPDEITNSAINNKINSLKRLLDKAKKKKWIISYPEQPQLTEKNKKDRSAISKSEVQIIFNAASIHLQLIFLLLIVLGVRKSELMELTVSNIDFENRIISAKVKKSRGKTKVRLIRIPTMQKLDSLLRQFCENHYDPSTKTFYKRDPSLETQWLFMNRYNERIKDFKTSWRNLIKKLAPQLSESYTPHFARHTFATMLSSKLTEEVLQDYLMHEQISCTRLYKHVNSNNLNLVSEENVNEVFGDLISSESEV